MIKYTLHTIETAPEESKPLLENSLKQNGMIPNLHAVMAESPQIFKAYNELHNLFANSSFNAEELTVVWQTINVEHECHYCVPAHTYIANSMKVDPAITQALRNSTPLPSEKLQILQDTTLAIVRNRGHLTTQQTDSFFAAGYTKRNLLDIVLGLSQKVISNYVNHIAETPVDATFEQFAWQK
ncbi:MAG: carboxymuconolactone decarboxylase family protein [Akkermansiaceae bacterium]